MLEKMALAGRERQGSRGCVCWPSWRRAAGQGHLLPETPPSPRLETEHLEWARLEGEAAVCPWTPRKNPFLLGTRAVSSREGPPRVIGG